MSHCLNPMNKDFNLRLAVTGVLRRHAVVSGTNNHPSHMLHREWGIQFNGEAGPRVVDPAQARVCNHTSRVHHGNLSMASWVGEINTFVHYGLCCLVWLQLFTLNLIFT